MDTDIGIVRTVSTLHSLSVNAEFNEIALDSDSMYKEIYLRALSLSYYNFLLEDYSVFQFSMKSEDEWRLAYLPNPWVTGVSTALSSISEWEALEEIGLYDQEDVAMLLGELPYHSSVPAIRFEYSAEQYAEFTHPGGHFHIGRDTDNRWATSRKFSPLLFVMMITKLYYRDKWLKNYKNLEDDCFEQKMILEIQGCGVSHHFSERERRTLHFSAR